MSLVAFLLLSGFIGAACAVLIQNRFLSLITALGLCLLLVISRHPEIFS